MLCITPSIWVMMGNREPTPSTPIRAGSCLIDRHVSTCSDQPPCRVGPPKFPIDACGAPEVCWVLFAKRELRFFNSSLIPNPELLYLQQAQREKGITFVKRLL